MIPRVTNDTLEIYLRDIGSYSTLGRDEEIAAAQQIERNGNKILWTVFRQDPEFLTAYFQEQLPQEEKKSKKEVKRLLTTPALSEKRFYERIESLRQIVSFTSTYPTVVETYQQKQDYDEEQVSFGDTRISLREINQKRKKLEEVLPAWEESRNFLAHHNLRYVVSLATKLGRGKMSLADCIQEGNEGLYRGVDGFDYRRGYKFVTYASWWIRQEIGRAISNTSRTIRIPPQMELVHNRIRKADILLRQKKGHDYVSVEEIVKATEFSAQVVVEALQVAEPASLDKVQTQNDEPAHLSYQSVIEDKASASPVEELFEKQQKSILHSTLESFLNPMELDIVRRRFGFGGEEVTLHQVGEKYGLSRERIRQIETKVLEKLKEHELIRELYFASR